MLHFLLCFQVDEFRDHSIDAGRSRCFRRPSWRFYDYYYCCCCYYYYCSCPSLCFWFGRCFFLSGRHLHRGFTFSQLEVLDAILKIMGLPPSSHINQAFCIQKVWAQTNGIRPSLLVAIHIFLSSSAAGRVPSQ